MSLSLKVNSTPITSIDTRLTDFFPELKHFNEIIEERLENEEEHIDFSKSTDELLLTADKIIQLKDATCKKHGIPLTKNGTNPRTVYTGDGHAFKGFRIQRYECCKCGEYSPDYEDFIPTHANYQEEVKAKARHLVYLGNTPGEVVKIFDTMGMVVPSESSIRNWLNEASEPIHEVVKTTKLPTSGYFGYDEIHLRVNGKKGYALNMVDVEHDFYVNAQYSPDRKNKSIISFFRESMRGRKMKMDGIVLDGAINYGSIFKKRGFTRVAVQLCHSHYKKTLNEKIYEASGLGKKLKEELSSPFKELKKSLFAPFNRSTLARAERQLALAEYQYYGEVSDDVDNIIDGVYNKFPSLFRYHVNRRLTHTNNPTEQMNLDLERYPSLKHHMKTGAGVNAILEGISFLHNFDAFQDYILQKEQKISRLRQSIADFPDDEELKSLKRGLKIHLSWVRKYYGQYKEVYLQYFKLNHKDFIVD